MLKLRPYQEEIAEQGLAILSKYKIVYLSMEVRVGKTLTALSIAERYGAKNVLFLTKKKAVESGTIQNDYNLLAPSYSITITNNESLHKVTGTFDLLISDEHHRNGSYPKPNITTKEIKKRYAHLPMIFLSGTPCIESSSQLYHQFWISNYSPFAEYKTFYKWAVRFVKEKYKYLYGKQIRDYSDAKTEDIMQVLNKYFIYYTQEQAGFETKIKENVVYYQETPLITKLKEQLLQNGIIQSKTDNILADTPAGLMTKIHQIESGTVITESGASYIIDKNKATFVRDYFKGKKIAIFYYYQKELELLKEVFGETLTTDLDEFKTTDKNFCIQQKTGSEAISLKEADALVYYNYGFGGKDFVQGRDRMTTKERAENNVYIILFKGGFNEKLYKVVSQKKRYNEAIFNKDYFGNSK
jgi:hypothetical protein